MDRIRELLGNLASITAAELEELLGLIDSEFDNLGEADATAEVADLLNELVGYREQVAGEQERRAVEAAEIEAKANEARDRMKLLRTPPEDKPEGDETKPTDEAKPEGGDEEVKPEGDAQPADADAGAGGDAASGGDGGGGDAIAAGAPRGSAGSVVTRMAAAAGRAQPGPEAEAARQRGAVTVVAAAPNLHRLDGEYVPPNSPIEDGRVLAEVMSGALIELSRLDGRNEARIASARWTFPEERRLGRDVEENTRKIESVCGFNAGRYDRGGALVATGGICLPVNIDYSVPTWSTADRPLRDGLPSFQASRGGVQYVAPPDIGTSSLEAGGPTGAGTGTAIWTAATDATPAGATKPVWQITCGAVETALVDAVPTRVEFGNMWSRFAPEQVAANTQQAIAAAARTAELNLLSRMYSASKQVLPKQYLGANRDLLASLDLLIAQYRYTHRIPRNASFTAVFPDWAKDLLRADLARELAHDTNGRDPLAVTDSQLEALLAARGVNCIWTLEGLNAGTYGTGGHAIPTQAFALATAGGQPQWPGQSTDAAFVLAWLLYVEGTFQFLDGGRLDLGVVRDSVLDATNDYETFVETFEGIAFRGLEVYQVQSTILPTGGSGGSVASSSYHE